MRLVGVAWTLPLVIRTKKATCRSSCVACILDALLLRLHINNENLSDSGRRCRHGLEDGSELLLCLSCQTQIHFHLGHCLHCLHSRCPPPANPVGGGGHLECTISVCTAVHESDRHDMVEAKTQRFLPHQLQSAHAGRPCPATAHRPCLVNLQFEARTTIAK